MELFDSTVVIDYLRGDRQTAQYLTSAKTPTISIVTEAEIYAGAKKKNEIPKLEKTLKHFIIIPLTPTICQKAIGFLKVYRLSHGLLILDAFIAATAYVKNAALVTANIKHFSMIKDLRLIAWP